jgi:hypothetical protein
VPAICNRVDSPIGHRISTAKCRFFAETSQLEILESLCWGLGTLVSHYPSWRDIGNWKCNIRKRISLPRRRHLSPLIESTLAAIVREMFVGIVSTYLGLHARLAIDCVIRVLCAPPDVTIWLKQIYIYRANLETPIANPNF